jgi:hypothetical protein
VQATATRELVKLAREAGAWKLLSRIFVEHETTRAVLAGLGFREVGTYYRHGKLDGRWRDVVVVEKFLAPIGAEAANGPGPARMTREQILDALRSGTLEARRHALDDAAYRIETVGHPDSALLGAVVDALFMAKVQDAAVRGRFVDLFRAYSALSRDAASSLYDTLFSRLAERSIAQDLDAFYEALFVVKQVARTPDDPARVVALANHLERLIGWMQEAIELPSGMRTRFSPGNVTTLLMTLALVADGSGETRQRVTELVEQAKARHRVDVPASLRPPSRASSPPPAIPGPPPLPPRLPPPPLPRRDVVPDHETILDLDELLIVDAPTSEPATARSAGMEDDPVAEAKPRRPSTRRKRPAETAVASERALPDPGTADRALPEPPQSDQGLSEPGLPEPGHSERALAEPGPTEAVAPKKKRAPRAKRTRAKKAAEKD